MDSRARIHLAERRTFFVWLRAGMNLIEVGPAAFLSVETRSYDPVATAMMTPVASVARFGLLPIPLMRLL
jgi:uncharacterized membrane protein YidH (DUF202 family)